MGVNWLTLPFDREGFLVYIIVIVGPARQPDRSLRSQNSSRNSAKSTFRVCYAELIQSSDPGR